MLISKGILPNFYRRILGIFITFVFVGLFLVVRGVSAEEINNYHVDIKINKDSTIDIVEEITYNFGNLQKHGIFRHLPVEYKTNNGSKRSIEIKNIKAFANGESVHFTKKRNKKNLNIKIGNKDKLVTGVYIYKISYTVCGAINYFDDSDELYWNAIGDEWPVNIQASFINVEAPNITKTTSFKGIYGSTNSCNVINSTNTKISFNCQSLDVKEGVTVVIGIEHGILYEPSLLIKILMLMLDNWILFLPIPIFIFMLRKWLLEGRDPEGRGTIIPFYSVADNLSLGEVSYLTYGRLPTKDLSAMIIQLGIKGFIKIEQTRKKSSFKNAEYTFHKINKSDNIVPNNFLTGEELLLFNGLFSHGDGTIVNTKELKNTFYTHIPKIKKSLINKLLSDKYLIGNPNKIIAKWAGIAFLITFFVMLSSIFFGILSIISGILIFIIIIGFGIFMPSYTKKGALIKEKLLGFKLYLKTAEKDRINFHNAPDKKPEIFEKFLPFAMIFGVEKEWAKQFKDIYTGQPEWYKSVDGQAFNSVILANNLNSFSDITSSSLSSSPSSASSGGSGFSGGGSGGGMGGGGGGSW